MFLQNLFSNNVTLQLFLKKETLAQVFASGFCEFSKNTFSYRTPPAAASVFWQTVIRLFSYKTNHHISTEPFRDPKAAKWIYSTRDSLIKCLTIKLFHAESFRTWSRIWKQEYFNDSHVDPPRNYQISKLEDKQVLPFFPKKLAFLIHTIFFWIFELYWKQNGVIWKKCNRSLIISFRALLLHIVH